MKVNQLKGGAFLSYLNIVLNIGVGLVYTPYMLRMMGQSEYGLYSLVASVVAYLTILDFGFGDAIVRYTAKYRAENKTKEQYELFGMFLIFYTLLGLVVLGAGCALYYNVDTLFDKNMTPEEVTKVRIMIMLLCFNLAFTFPMSIWGAIVSAYEKFIYHKAVSTVRVLLNPIIMLVVLHLGYRAIGMVVVVTALNIMTLLAYLWYCIRVLKIKLAFGKLDKGLTREILQYSFWVFLSSIMDRVYWSTGQFVLGIYRGTVAIAVYALAIQLQSMYMSFSTAISGVFLPKVTSMITKGKSMQEVSNLFIKTGRIQYVIMGFALCAFIVFGQPFIKLWAGDNYEDTYFVALMFLIPLTVPLIQNLGITILRAKNQLRFRSLSYFAISIASLAISFPLAKYYGYYGCAIAVALGLVIGQIVVMNIYYSKIVNLDIVRFWKEIAKMSIVPILMALCGKIAFAFYTINSLFVFLIIVVSFTIVYFSLLFTTTMNKVEKNLVSVPITMLLNKVVRKRR